METLVTQAVVPVISILLSGGLILGLMRMNPERQNLLADANSKAVKSLISSMDELESRLLKAQEREADLLVEMADLRREMTSLRMKLDTHKSDLIRLTVERDAWKQRAIDAGYKDT